jgi:PD-(D/E)XK nuclease superfamily
MDLPQSHRDTEINQLTSRIVGWAIEVHRALGPGLLEPMYETALCIELDAAGVKIRSPGAHPGLLQGPLSR